MKKLKVVSKTETTITLELSLGDGIDSLHEFFKNITKETFVICDKNDDYQKAFFFKPKFSVDITRERRTDAKSARLTFSDCTFSTGLQLLSFAIYLRNNGNSGHSFGIEDNHGNEAGWDGDGSDSVIAIYLNDKKLPYKAYSFNDYELQKYFSDNK